MSRGDVIVERAADGLQQLADKAAARGGLVAKLADELAEDAAFVRKLKPSLIVARARGEASTDGKPGDTTVVRPQVTPAPPEGGGRGDGGGPNPFVVIGIALAVGVLLAKVLDWRGHAHPRW